jgi:hypothetical protein
MSKNEPIENSPDQKSQPVRLPLDPRSELWHSGVAAGEQWAFEELSRGYAHPLHVESAQTERILIEHAQDAFGGRCQGKPRLFIRGFIHGVAQVCRSIGKDDAKGPETAPKD